MSLEAFPTSQIDYPRRAVRTQLNPNVIRTTMESGRPRQRPTDINELEIVSVQWAIPSSQYRVFRAWHNQTINRGSDWFTMDLDIDGDNTKNYEVRFVGGSYSASRDTIDDHFIVDATLELIDRNLETFVP